MAYSWLPFLFWACANVAGGFASDALVKRIGLKWGRRWIGFGAYSVTAMLIAATIFTDDNVLTVIFHALAYGCSDFALPTAWAVCLDVGRKHADAVTGAMNTAGQAVPSSRPCFSAILSAPSGVTTRPSSRSR